MEHPASSPNLDWLHEILDEVGLRQFYPKLTNDLQLTKLSHFDFVSEEDLIQLGLSKPAARRLLSAIRKRKSFVTALKNKLVSKLVPLSTHLNSSAKNKSSHENIFGSNSKSSSDKCEFGRLTCLINSQDVQVKEEIGHGVHGFVKKGEWTTPNGRVVEVALKILKKDVMSEPGASFNDFVKEISVMHQLNHPNIIKLYGIVLSSPMMMVTELAPHGNLRDKLRNENGATPISQLINFGVQIAFGMEYLDSKRFVHRDLAARNIFIGHGKKILIGDLGLMRAIPNQEDLYIMSERTKIPYPWCAPESLKFKQFSGASDVYMFGVTLWEMFSFGKEPWAGMNLGEIIENISSQKRRLPCPDACPTMVYQTLLQCWDIEPTCRPNFSTLYQYLSTSYPLEVRSNQHISEVGQKRQNGLLLPNDLKNSPSASEDHSKMEGYNRKVLSCNPTDRILVIDGQPEKYWWKGQNQRTFEIGWFPLSCTRWLAPKKGPNFIGKPFKNSFINLDNKWVNPLSSDNHESKNSHNTDIKGFTNIFQAPNAGNSSTRYPNPSRHKTKSRLSKLFGLGNIDSNNLGSTGCHISSQTYHKLLNNDSKSISRNNSDRANPLARSQSDEIRDKPDNEPPLIDLSDDGPSTSGQNLMKTELRAQQESLIDIDNGFFVPEHLLPRHASDTELNRMNGDNYNLSWAGSWNTGTFDDSNSNIYSAYYCPQDAGIHGVKESESIRYYSAVSRD